MQSRKIIGIRSLGPQRTVDIEVASNDHVFYGNGVATSNSHAVSYAILGYWSAYLKAHYPATFYLNWLRQADEKIDPDQETRELVVAAKNDGLKVYGPSIEHLSKNFEEYNDTIYFGLCNVKNVGEREFDRIQDSLNTIKYSEKQYSFEQLSLSCLLSLNKRAVDNLVLVGFLHPYRKSRLSMIHELSCLRELTDKELDWLRENWIDEGWIPNLERLAPPKKEGGGTANKNRSAIIHDIIMRIKNPGRSLWDNPSVISKIEYELLGCELSAFEIDACEDASLATITCADFNNRRVDYGVIAASIKEFREHNTKNEKKMGFLSLGDKTGELENIIVFPDQYEKFSDIIYIDSTVLVTGERDRDGGKSFIVEKIEQI